MEKHLYEPGERLIPYSPQAAAVFRRCVRQELVHILGQEYPPLDFAKLKIFATWITRGEREARRKREAIRCKYRGKTFVLEFPHGFFRKA